jgi:hypothetical protein
VIFLVCFCQTPFGLKNYSTMSSAAESGGTKRRYTPAGYAPTAEEARSVRPRSSTGALSPPSTAVTPAADAAAAAPPLVSLAPINRLYRHALESVFIFAILRELHTYGRVCRAWRAAVQSAPSIQAMVRLLRTDSSFAWMLDSALAHHVGALTCNVAPLHAYMPFFMMELTPAKLIRVCSRMPMLHHLCCDFTLSAFAAERLPVMLPRSLQVLHAELQHTLQQPLHLEPLLVAASTLPQLHELRLKAQDFNSADFSPLIAAHALRSFCLLPCYRTPLPSRLTDAQVDQMRQLVQLHSLRVPLGESQMARLLALPHRLQQLQVLDPEPCQSAHWTEGMAALLVHLPSLTTVNMINVELDHVDFVTQLPALRSVHLGFAQSAPLERRMRDVTRILSALRQRGSTLTSLSLRCSAEFLPTADDFAALLPHFPVLSNLSLSWHEKEQQFAHLGFLLRGSLPATLKELTLSGNGATVVARTHVHVLRSLSALETLRIYHNCGPVALSDRAALQALLELPVEGMPALRWVQIL